MENKKHYLQGIWRGLNDGDQNEPKKNLYIRGMNEKDIIEKILNSTNNDGIIELYKIKFPNFESQPLKTFRVCRNLDPCCV